MIRGILLTTLLLLPAFLWLGCTSEQNGGGAHGTAHAAGEPSPIVLHDGASSPEELTRLVLQGITSADTLLLTGLLINREEYEALYPELQMHYPLTADQRPETRQFLWENQYLGALKEMRRGIRDLGGRTMEFLSVGFPNAGKTFRSYTIYEYPEVRVRMEDGREAHIHLLGSIVQAGNSYKLMSYRDRSD